MFEEDAPLEGFGDVLLVPVGQKARRLVPRCKNQDIRESLHQIHHLFQANVRVLPPHFRGKFAEPGFASFLSLSLFFHLLRAKEDGLAKSQKDRFFGLPAWSFSFSVANQ